MSYASKSTLLKHFAGATRTYAVVGGALTIILALIGILNFTNAIVSSVDARRYELTVLQCIGMTGKQLKSMLSWEGILYALTTMLFVLTAGSGLTWLLVKLISRDLWFFTWHFSLLPVLFCIPCMVVISIAVPQICYSSYSRSSLIERLRKAE